MKPFRIKIKDTLFYAAKITMAQSREAIRINNEKLELSKYEESGTVEDATYVYAKLDELLVRQLILICEVFENKFTIDELQNELTRAQVEDEVRKIITGTVGIVTKNE